MRMPKVTVTLACAALLACTAEMSLREQGLIQQAVENQLDGWVRALANRDADSVAAMYHQVDGLTVVWPDGRVTHGWEEELAAQQEFFANVEQINFVKQTPQIEILDADHAVATFRYSLDVVREGNVRDTPLAGSVTMLWVRDPADDLWKIHLEHLSVNPGG